MQAQKPNPDQTELLLDDGEEPEPPNKPAKEESKPFPGTNSAGPLPNGDIPSIKAQIKVHLEELDEILLKELLLFCQNLLKKQTF